MNEIDGVACGTPGCDNRGKPGLNLVGYGSFATKSGRRQRYRCTVCRALTPLYVKTRVQAAWMRSWRARKSVMTRW